MLSTRAISRLRDVSSCRTSNLLTIGAKKNVAQRPIHSFSIQQQGGRLQPRSGSNRRTKSTTKDPSPQTTSTKLSPEEEARAERMFEELNALMIKRQAKLDAERSRTWSEAIHTFLSNSKHQLINVAATFACLLMAIQVADARITARKKDALWKEASEQVKELNQRLDRVRSEEFARQTADKCVRSMNENASSSKFSHDMEEDATVRKSWFGFLTAKSKSRIDDSEEEDLSEILGSIIRQEIKVALGDVGMNDSEKAELELRNLQSFIGTGDEMNPAAKELVAAVGETEETTEDGTTVIKKRKIMF